LVPVLMVAVMTLLVFASPSLNLSLTLTVILTLGFDDPGSDGTS